MEALRARQPKELLRNDVFSTVPPQDVTPTDLADLASSSVIANPASILKVYKRHTAGGEEPDVAVLIRAFTQLGFLFDPNSFFSTADRQLLTAHKDFRSLAHDLTHASANIPPAAVPVLLYAMACLEYRCAPLLPALLDAVERHMGEWRVEVLTLLLHSAASLGLGGAEGEPVEFDEEGGARGRDHGQICRLIMDELGERIASDDAAGIFVSSLTLHDWSRAAFAVAMAGLYDGPSGRSDGALLPRLVAGACAQIDRQDELDASGWAQFFLYQTLYCVDVEKPACEEQVKRAMPMWVQERLHQRWLDGIVLHAQPQGADELQRDVDASLRRTNTQSLLNCSAGRAWDEQHCWFAGFLLEPKVALECDSLMPLGPGRPRPSGWLAMKSRILRKIGYKVVTIHRCFWSLLTEDQKDEQILRLRSEVGYVHDRELEKKQKKVRQEPYTYKGLESKPREWVHTPPGPPAQ